MVLDCHQVYLIIAVSIAEESARVEVSLLQEILQWQEEVVVWCLGEFLQVLPALPLPALAFFRLEHLRRAEEPDSVLVPR